MIDKIQTLTPAILSIVRDAGTEAPFSGQYYQPTDKKGTYLCRRCGLALFRAPFQFASSCGWPSFDEELPHTILQRPDSDGRRTEILCNRCQAHLGHIFLGEYLTPNNLRYCVNSLALDFAEDDQVLDTEEAIYAGGCFWGVEHLLQTFQGVIKTEVGYIGGHLNQPTYEVVCKGNTGHLEAVRVLYDPTRINYKQLTQYFFEIHDPTQVNGQGPDRGEQYRSGIFTLSEDQQTIAHALIQQLEKKGLSIVTLIQSATTFWPAEILHQHYYLKTGKTPYCHHWRQRF